MRALVVATLIIGGTLGCRPPPTRSPGLVDGPRVLAVRASPAEVAPGGRAGLEALIVDEGGDVDAPQVGWSLCTTPRAPGEGGALPAACLDDAGAVPVDDEADTDALVDVDVPADACATFGPETGSGLRPRDADSTGGHHQPLRLDVVVTDDDDDTALRAAAFVRLACRLGDAPVEIAQRFAAAHRDNRNPAGLVVDVPDVVGAGDAVDLSVAWGDDDAERYLCYDRASGDLVEAREQLTASFFVTDGQLAAERLVAPDGATGVDNRWTAPDVGSVVDGVVHLWVVLRDGRGGTAWSAQRIVVE